MSAHARPFYGRSFGALGGRLVVRTREMSSRKTRWLQWRTRCLRRNAEALHVPTPVRSRGRGSRALPLPPGPCPAPLSIRCGSPASRSTHCTIRRRLPPESAQSRNIGTVLDTATSAHPAAAMTRPISNVRRTPMARATMPTKPACTMTPSTPNAASTYPVRTTSKPKRRDAKSANVVVQTANEHQYTKSAIRQRAQVRTAEHLRHARATAKPTPRCRGARSREPHPRHRRCHHRDGGSGPDGRRVADVREQPGETGTDDKSKAEGGAQKAKCLRSLVRLGDIGDVRAGDRDVSARQSVDDARRKQHRQALRNREHGEADHRADEAEDQDRAPPEPIGECAEHGRGHELREGKRGEEKADDYRRRTERLCVERQQRNDDAEADEIDEDREEDDEQRTRHAPTIIC